MKHEVICDKAEDWLQRTDDSSVDLIFGSPPYEDKRTYGIDFAIKGEEWVAWMVEIFITSVKVSRGLTAYVVGGKTKNFCYSSVPARLEADLSRLQVCRKCGCNAFAHRITGKTMCQGCGSRAKPKRLVHTRRSPIYMRRGIPGSGGPDWLADLYEPIICATSGGRLPWSDNTAMGHPPKYGPGGAPSHRTTAPRGHQGGDARVMNAVYKPPKLANPGNVIHCHGGGGHLGSKLAHENEAPFSEKLAEFFIRSFCPPGGTVLDPFAGSGTVAAAAERCGRNSISVDIRQSQVDLTKKRLAKEHGCKIE